MDTNRGQRISVRVSNDENHKVNSLEKHAGHIEIPIQINIRVDEDGKLTSVAAQQAIKIEDDSFEESCTPSAETEHQSQLQSLSLVADPESTSTPTQESPNWGPIQRSIKATTIESRRQRIGSRLGVFWTDVRNAFKPRVDEHYLKSFVWYIESKFEHGTQSGTGVVIRVSKDGCTKNLLLTCQHVVRDRNTGQDAIELRCWPESSGYNPGSSGGRNWKAEVLVWCSDDSPNGFVQDGSLDWVLLEVTREGQNFDVEPFAGGFSTTKNRALQTVDPYHLVGFPGGNITMNRDVVRASVSRSFRLSGTDANSGQFSLVGPEFTAPGLSGAPYMNQHGQVVAIHRGAIGNGGTKTGVSTRPIETVLSERGFSIIKRTAKYWRYRLIQAVAGAVVLGLLCLSLYLSTPHFTVEVVEGSRAPLTKLDSTAVELAAPEGEDPYQRAKFGSGRGKISDGHLDYRANIFVLYPEPTDSEKNCLTDFTRTETVNFKRRWLGFIPLPSGLVTVKVRRHLDKTTPVELYNKLFEDNNFSNTELTQVREEWSNLETAPAITLPLEGFKTGSWKGDKSIYFKYKAKLDGDKRPQLDLYWDIGFKLQPAEAKPVPFNEDESKKFRYHFERVMLYKIKQNTSLNRVEFRFKSLD